VFAHTIRNFELGASDPKLVTVQMSVAALAKEGVEFALETDEARCGVRV
jgi:hypothetical protein